MEVNQAAIKMPKPQHTYPIEKKEVVNLHSSPIRDPSRLIREHDFITVRIKEANNSFVVLCTTCGVYFCDLCGKALNKKSG